MLRRLDTAPVVFASEVVSDGPLRGLVPSGGNNIEFQYSRSSE